MVWEVLGSSKGKWEAMGFVPREMEEAPIIFKFFLEIHKRGA
jgi:hypothetical protein